ncbi:MAG TPA: DUF2203 domain-containing protein [Bryobacteraceae bacterium]|nr:DUF2203 domain-containing protein [Bryobacteraceae bacterium]
MPRYFTLAEAQAALGQLEAWLREATELKAALDDAEGEFHAEAERIRITGGAVARRETVVDVLRRREAAAARLRAVIESIQASGCLVKDLDAGLLDFPTLLRDREVYLCWKLGEPEIAFWHGIEEGFRGRKPIEQDFLDHHRGQE